MLHTSSFVPSNSSLIEIHPFAKFRLKLNKAIGVWPKSNPLWLHSGGDRFKGLDLVDRVPEELWTEVRDTAQEVVTKTIPKKEKYKKANWLSEEALQIA